MEPQAAMPALNAWPPAGVGVGPRKTGQTAARDDGPVAGEIPVCDLCRRFGFQPRLNHLGTRFSVAGQDVSDRVALLVAPWTAHASGWDSEPAARLAQRTAEELADWACRNGHEEVAEALCAGAADLQKLLDSPLDLNHVALQMVWDRLGPAVQGIAEPAEAVRGDDTADPRQAVVSVEPRALEELLEGVSGLFVLGDWLQATGARIASDHKLRGVVEELQQINRELKTQSETLQRGIFELQTESSEPLVERLGRAAVQIAAGQGFRLSLECRVQSAAVDRRAVEAVEEAARLVLEFLLVDSADLGVGDADPEAAPVGPLAVSEDALALEIDSHTDHGRVVFRFGRPDVEVSAASVRRQAMAGDLVGAEEAEQFDDQAAMQLLLRPGMARPEGLGSDYRKQLGLHEAAALVAPWGGRLEVRSTPDEGTAVLMALPSQQGATTVDALLVEQGGGLFLVPFDFVREVAHLEAGSVYAVQGRPTAIIQGSPQAALGLDELLGLDRCSGAEYPQDSGRPGILVEHEATSVVLLVERVLGHRKVVVRSLERILPGVRDVSGVAPLDQGQLALVLDVPNLLARLAGTG